MPGEIRVGHQEEFPGRKHCKGGGGVPIPLVALQGQSNLGLEDLFSDRNDSVQTRNHLWFPSPFLHLENFCLKATPKNLLIPQSSFHPLLPWVSRPRWQRCLGSEGLIPALKWEQKPRMLPELVSAEQGQAIIALTAYRAARNQRRHNQEVPTGAGSPQNPDPCHSGPLTLPPWPGAAAGQGFHPRPEQLLLEKL